jgi:segregation and condensation protein B
MKMKYKDIDQSEEKMESTKDMYFSVIESLLFVSGEPLKIKEIAAIIECDIDFTKDLVKEFSKMFEATSRGIKLITLNDSYQLVTKEKNSDYIQKLLRINTRQSLSQAALETLAIVAYKQPITRIIVDEIRGVKSDRGIIALVDRNLIKECGRMDVPGRPILYSTTSEFLKCFGLEKLEQLPPLEEFMKQLEENLIQEDDI